MGPRLRPDADGIGGSLEEGGSGEIGDPDGAEVRGDGFLCSDGPPQAASRKTRSRPRVLRRCRGADYEPFFAFIAAVISGRTFRASPTIPRSAYWKMGASLSLLMAMMRLELFIPTRCWIAPEIPMAM